MSVNVCKWELVWLYKQLKCPKRPNDTEHFVQNKDVTQSPFCGPQISVISFHLISFLTSSDPQLQKFVCVITKEKQGTCKVSNKISYKQTLEWNSEVWLIKQRQRQRWWPAAKLVTQQWDETTTKIYTKCCKYTGCTTKTHSALTLLVGWQEENLVL